MITAIGNDTSFDDIFVEQMNGVFNKEDLLLSITASGNSTNIIKAIKFAKKLNGKTISFCGFDGGTVKKISDLTIFTSSKTKEYGPVEDIHMILNHMLINYLCSDEEFINLD